MEILNHTTMNYSLFLFSKLNDLMFNPQYEYDRQYDDLVVLFQEYQQSEFNKPDADEYTCMVSFLESKENDIRAVIEWRHKQ